MFSEKTMAVDPGESKNEISQDASYAQPYSDGTTFPDKEGGDDDDAESQGEELQRGNWGGQLEFILTCVGYAVGLGNVWRFPYLVYRNGGGAFLIPYFLMLAFVGLPLFYLELAFGQFASLGPIAIWQVSPVMKGLGFAMVITNTIIGLYYNIIIGWSIYYFFASMTDQLPWEFCGNWWNTKYCFHSDDLKNITGNITIDGEVIMREDIKTPSEEYYYNQVLRISDGIDHMGEVQWQLALCLLISWTIVFFVLIKGISSLGKVVYFSSIFPYILLTIMLIRGVTLPGAMTGIEYYLLPDWERLLDANVWSDAATQIFYSLSACTGGLIAMASFNKFHNNCYRDSLIVPLINCFTSFYAGFVIFSVLGFMAEEKGVHMDDVADSGPGLVFVVYPEGLTQMPVSPLWSILFFFMLITLGFSSEFSMIECFFASITDEFPRILRRNRLTQVIFRATCIVIFYLISLPMVTEGGFYLFNLVDVYVGGFPLLFIGFFEAVALCYIYGYRRFSEDIAMMLGKKPTLYFMITWCVVSPLILFGIIIFMIIQYTPLTLFDDYEYPEWSLIMGWFIVLFPMVFIPAVFIYTVFSRGGYQVLKKASSPTKEWGPALKENRTGRYAMEDQVPVTTEVIYPKKEMESTRKRFSSVYATTAYATDLNKSAYSSVYPGPEVTYDKKGYAPDDPVVGSPVTYDNKGSTPADPYAYVGSTVTYDNKGSTPADPNAYVGSTVTYDNKGFTPDDVSASDTSDNEASTPTYSSVVIEQTPSTDFVEVNERL